MDELQAIDVLYKHGYRCPREEKRGIYGNLPAKHIITPAGNTRYVESYIPTAKRVLAKSRPKAVQCNRCDDLVSCKPPRKHVLMVERYCACGSLKLLSCPHKVFMYAEPEPFKMQMLWQGPSPIVLDRVA